jgi:DivIVA domain-containing protein
MAISPAEIRALQFSTVKRGGYDQREVESFRTAAADALEAALQESTAMEARARAAVARLQELSQQTAAAAPEPIEGEATPAPGTEAPAAEPAEAAPAPRKIAVDEAETISRTLLLAQRTADTTVAEAEAAAQERLSAAEADAARIVESAKAESRRAGEAERVKVEGEVQALLARRDFLESDVDHLDQHLQVQRERITEVVAELTSITGRVVNGLAPMRRPQLSASDHSGDQARPAAEELPPSTEDEDDIDVSSLIDQTREAGDTTSPVERPEPDVGDGEGDGPHDLFSHDDR